MRPPHRFSFYQTTFLYIAFCVHSVVCGCAHSVIPVLLSFSLNYFEFSSYTILRTLYTSPRKDIGFMIFMAMEQLAFAKQDGFEYERDYRLKVSKSRQN